MCASILWRATPHISRNRPRRKSIPPCSHMRLLLVRGTPYPSFDIKLDCFFPENEQADECKEQGSSDYTAAFLAPPSLLSRAYAWLRNHVELRAITEQGAVFTRHHKFYFRHWSAVHITHVSTVHIALELLSNQHSFLPFAHHINLSHHTQRTEH